MRFALAATSLWRREMVRFFRQRSGVVASLATPLLFWLLFSIGFGASFDAGRTSSGQPIGSFAFFFPGTVTLVILFTAIFTNISLIQDRREGFLQGVLVAPVPRAAIAFGKIFGGASIAFLQGSIFLAIGSAFARELSVESLLLSCAGVGLLSIALAGLGFAFAWHLDSVQGFHSVMNLVLMPMWVLSGALFPPGGVPRALAWAMAANPATHGLNLMRHGYGVAAADLPSMQTSFWVSFAFAAGALSLAWLVAADRRPAGRSPAAR
jgi:ABC-2 type transport system permease protein